MKCAQKIDMALGVFNISSKLNRIHLILLKYQQKKFKTITIIKYCPTVFGTKLLFVSLYNTRTLVQKYSSQYLTTYLHCFIDPFSRWYLLLEVQSPHHL